MPNYYLIGMMGAGKTNSGKSLAQKLSFNFVDLDVEIEKAERLSIPEIFDTKGEEYFRLLERKVLTQVSKNQDQVVATGGGVVLDPKNISRMKKSGRVIYLETSPECLWERVSESKGRPLIQGPNAKEKFEDILNTRLVLYQKTADLAVGTDHKNAEEVAELIKRELES